ncbi:MAG: glycosyltransferase [Desulfovibrio sp.]|jgi:glycosyltransferase involved in cell wall biosynthesis|nr:glycosyltransferase [Desulfovibrio sp.]
MTKKQTSPARLADGARIDIIGNANNYPLALVRGLRGLAFDAHLHLTMSGMLNAPENRYSAYADTYPEWIHDWRGLGDTLWSSPAMMEAVRRESAAADALVLNYDAVSLGATEARPYFCLLTGTDLMVFADPHELKNEIRPPDASVLEHYPNRAYVRNWVEFCLRQRSAIRQAEGYSFFPRGCFPQADEVLVSLGAFPERQHSFLLTETDELTFCPPRVGDRLRIILGARLTWDRTAKPYRTELDYKGSDIFLRGFADFIRQGGKAEARLFRKGDHVRQTEELANELGLSAFVRWSDELNQKEFLEALRVADVMVDQIGKSHIGMGVVDSMSLGRPVIASAPDYKAWNWPCPLPICHADNAEDVCAWLDKLASNPALRGEIASRSRTFAEGHFSPGSVASRVAASLRQPALRQEVSLFQMLAVCGKYDEKEYKTHSSLKQEHAKLLREGIKASSRRLAHSVLKKFTGL